MNEETCRERVMAGKYRDRALARILSAGGAERVDYVEIVNRGERGGEGGGEVCRARRDQIESNCRKDPGFSLA